MTFSIDMTEKFKKGLTELDNLILLMISGLEPNHMSEREKDILVEKFGEDWEYELGFKKKKKDLKEYIDWDLVMKQPRLAGGHEAIMRNIFGNNAEVIAEHIDNDWQGEEVFAYKMEDGVFVIITDSFGSCSGCDSWERASDEEAKRLITTLVNNSRTFETFNEMIEFCKRSNDDAEDFHFRRCVELVSDLEEYSAEVSM